MTVRRYLIAAVALGWLGACSDDTGPDTDASVGTDGATAEIDAMDPGGTDGCGIALSIAAEEWVEATVDVGGQSRAYYVYVPADYDPQRRYPVVYQFHGCSGNPDRHNNNPPVQAHSGSDAIHVRGQAVDNCWDNSANGTGVAMFDALVSEMEARFCTDPERRFASGYSSGAFMSHQLACVRGEQLRAVATIGGGIGGNNCTGTTAALIIHDEGDNTVQISTSEAARDGHLARNGCDTGTPPTAVDPAPCVEYSGCPQDTPVIWCQTTGQGHNRQDGLSGPAFWGLFQGF